MHNQPDAIDSPEARCPTHPQVGDVTASQHAPHVVKAMNEGQLAVRRDVQVAYLVGDASKSSEDLLPASTLFVSPEVSQGRGDIECNVVGRIEGHDAVDVLRAKRIRPVLYALSNEGFSHGLPPSHPGTPVPAGSRSDSAEAERAIGSQLQRGRTPIPQKGLSTSSTS